MEIKKINPSELDGFAELIKSADRSQNTCACSGILSKPAAQSKVLQALASDAHRHSKLAAETGDEFYADHAQAIRELWKELRIEFGIEDNYEED